MTTYYSPSNPGDGPFTQTLYDGDVVYLKVGAYVNCTLSNYSADITIGSGVTGGFGLSITGEGDSWAVVTGTISKAGTIYAYVDGENEYDNPSCNVTIYAINNSCTLSLTAFTGGTVSGGGTYTIGTTVTITATPNQGYVFMAWTDGGAATHTVTVNSDMSLFAYFCTAPDFVGSGTQADPYTRFVCTAYYACNLLEGQTIYVQAGSTVEINDYDVCENGDFWIHDVSSGHGLYVENYELKGTATTPGTVTVTGTDEADEDHIFYIVIVNPPAAKTNVKVNGSWVKGSVYVKVNGSWVESKKIYTKVNGTWRESV